MLLGGAGALAGALSAPRPPSTSLALAPSDAPTATTADTGTGNPTAAVTATATLFGGAPTPTVTQVAPTATPTRVPPTATPIPVPGQSLTVRGAVTSVSPSTNTFVVHVFNGGGTYTCTVTSSTQWSGAATSISTLQVGMRVDASGTYQGGGRVTTSSVVADN
jgi:hypothetical protein